MTQEEYKSKLTELQNEFEAKKKELAKEYAFANNPYKVGDVITDHSGTIRIENIKWAFRSFGYAPQCVYNGTQLRKDGAISKRQEHTKIYQENIIPQPLKEKE